MRSACLAAMCGVLVVVAACDKPGQAQSGMAGAPSAANADAPPVLLLAAEDLLTIGTGAAGGGPVITGSLQPERRADLRAEVAAVVTQVLKDNGQPVKRGDLLMRLDDTAIRESLQSAQAGERAAAQAYEQAQRQVGRLKTLQAQGMTSAQALDDAEGRRNAAQSDLVAARARVVSAQQQLRRTEVRAPFDGVVSERKASVGDTAQIGKELVKVIDPASMRFEGLVSADRLGELKIGQRVQFRVNGVEGVAFGGRVQRVDAAANAVTRQVEVLVTFDDPAAAPRVAGLYAEGRIEGSGSPQPMLADNVITRRDGKTFAWRVDRQSNTLTRVAVQLGERDSRSGEFPISGGLATGEIVLRNPNPNLVDGQKVEFARASDAAGSAPAASAVGKAPAGSGK